VTICPDMIQSLSVHSGYNLKTVEEYIKQLPCSSIKPVTAGADIISEGVIQALIDQTDKIVVRDTIF